MKLFFFTNSYPYGLPDNWKTIELEEFSKHYQEINVFPFNDAGVPGIKVRLPPNIRISAPLLRRTDFGQAFTIALKSLFSTLPYYFLREFVNAGVYRDWTWTKRWFRASFYTAAIYFDHRFRQLLHQNTSDSTWYFYWGNHMALVLPLIRDKVRHIAVRVHNSDLYKEVDGGYLPYQSTILQSADLILPCSNDGRNYLLSNFRLDASRVHTARLGVILQLGQVAITDVSPFKIVSCSFLFPTKRVRLIAEALSHLDFPVHWTHIGPGKELEELQSYCRDFTNKNIQVELVGYMKHDDIVPYYLAEDFQLFVNASQSEGIPVSIMEAMSVGIPAVATNVGGSGELVSNEEGFLLPVEIHERELAKAIESFRYLPLARRQTMSANCIRKIAELYDGRKNAKTLRELFTKRFYPETQS